MSASRDRLIHTATQLFTGGSFHKVGIAEICAAAEVNKGTFYHFFPSKIELLLEVIDGYVKSISDKYREIAASSDSGRRKLKSVFSVPQQQNETWKVIHGTTSGCFLGTMILELVANEPAVRNKARWGVDEWSNSLKPIVEQFLGEEKIRHIDATSGADMIVGLMQGAHVMAKVKNDSNVFAAYGQLAIEILSSGKV